MNTDSNEVLILQTYIKTEEFLRSEINEDEHVIRNMFDRDVEYIDSW